jgi:hypothetical protein
MRRTFRVCFYALLSASLSVAAAIAWQGDFQWDWRRNEELTRKDSLRQAKLTPTEKVAISKAITDQLRPDMFSAGFESEEQLKNIALDARIKMVDLDGDSAHELIAQGGDPEVCSPTGNCFFWLFRKTNRNFKLLLYAEGIQMFTIQRTRTNGFRDIVLAMHGSAAATQLMLYKYSNGAYHDVACYNANWTVLEADTLRELTEPSITPCGAR